MTGGVQEGLVCLLCYEDGPKGASFVRSLVDPRAYDPYWRDIAIDAAAFIDQYGKAPGDETASLIESLCTRSPKKADVYLRLFESMKETHANPNLHVKYILDQASAFARYQRLRGGLDAALAGLEKDSAEGVLEAEAALTKALKASADVADPGVVFTSPEALDFLDDEEECWPIHGIKELDACDLGPGPGKLWLLIALAKAGKSYFLVNIAKQAILHGKTVLYVTLELSRKLVTKRAFQVFFALTKKQVTSKLKRIKFVEDELGRFVDFTEVEISDRPALTDLNIKGKLQQYQRRLEHRPKLVIKEFPSGELTLRQLDGYLDLLEGMGILPDLMIVDYADLMAVDHKHLRESLNGIYVGLRGIAGRRKIAVATVSQSNRQGTKATKIDVGNVAEDWGKIAVADTVLTLSRTDEEKEVGLARIFVAAGREDADRFTVLISQNLAIGQFALDSTRMSDSYWKRVSGDKEEAK